MRTDAAADTETDLPRADLDHAVALAGDALEGLRGARVLVTGGTGFLGGWLVGTLARANASLGLGASAVLLTRDAGRFRARLPSLARAPGIEILEGDVRALEAPAGGVDWVVHAAGDAAANSGGGASPEETFETLVLGTSRAARAAREGGARGLLHVSSGAVYGRQPLDLERLSEERYEPSATAAKPALVDPRAAYAEGKRAAEEICAAAALEAPGGPRISVARVFAVIGPGMPLDGPFAAGNFVRDGLAGGPVRVGGDGTPLRSLLHAADAAAWLWTILLRGAPGRAYNVGAHEAVSIGDLARRVASRFGVETQVRGTPDPARPPERYLPSIERARRELGVRVAIGLDDAIERTARWHLERKVG